MNGPISTPAAMLRLPPESDDIPAVLDLLRRCFAFMEGRIDPPSSLRRLTAQALRDHCAGPKGQEIWSAGSPPQACVFLTPKPHALYLGRLAVDPQARGLGLARKLIDLASERASQLGLPVLELEVRVELVENQAAFTRMGFHEVARTAHPGFDRMTSITMQRHV